jgi:hypothetical protein
LTGIDRKPSAGPTAAPSGGTAIDEMFASAYADLRRLAQARLHAGGRDVVLDTTKFHMAVTRLRSFASRA